MARERRSFKKALQACDQVVKELHFVVVYTNNLDPFYKGDLDGKRIFLSETLSAGEKLFNLVHLSGHNIQWNTNEELRKMGAHLHPHPDDELLKRLQTYEWQASCYGLSILHRAGITSLDEWLTKKYTLDMMYLTHFYKTGEKLKRITKTAKAYPFKKELKEKQIPSFTPVISRKTRNGIVIAF